MAISRQPFMRTKNDPPIINRFAHGESVSYLFEEKNGQALPDTQTGEIELIDFDETTGNLVPIFSAPMTKSTSAYTATIPATETALLIPGEYYLFKATILDAASDTNQEIREEIWFIAD
jgi:hypothetical protein